MGLTCVGATQASHSLAVGASSIACFPTSIFPQTLLDASPRTRTPQIITSVVHTSGVSPRFRCLPTVRCLSALPRHLPKILLSTDGHSLPWLPSRVLRLIAPIHFELHHPLY